MANARTLLLALLAGATVLAAAGCDRVSEPWDSTDYFAKDRMRSAAQEAELRQRAMAQSDRTHE